MSCPKSIPFPLAIARERGTRSWIAITSRPASRVAEAIVLKQFAAGEDAGSVSALGPSEQVPAIAVDVDVCVAAYVTLGTVL